MVFFRLKLCSPPARAEALIYRLNDELLVQHRLVRQQQRQFFQGAGQARAVADAAQGDADGVRWFAGVEGVRGRDGHALGAGGVGQFARGPVAGQ